MTSRNNSEIHYEKNKFYVSLAFTIVNLVSISYFLASFAYFTWKKNHLLCKKHHKNKATAKWLSLLLNSAAISMFLYSLIDIPLYTEIEAAYCDYYRRLKITCTSFCYFTVYFTLWFRVYKIFYQNPFLNQALSTFTRWCAYLTIPYIFIMTLLNNIIFVLLNSYVKSELSFGCERTNKPANDLIRWSIYLTASVSSQALILFILVKPLVLHRKNALGQGIESQTVIPIIKRAAVMATICISSDTAQTILSIADQNDSTFGKHFVYQANVWINFLAITFSFSDWKLRLFPNKLNQHLKAQQGEKQQLKEDLKQATTHGST